MSGQNFGTKDVLLLELRHVFEVLDSQPQVVEFPARKIQHAQRQSRSEDAVFHHLVVHQLELCAFCKRTQRRYSARARLRFFPGLGGKFYQQIALGAKRQRGIAPLLHFASAAALNFKRGKLVVEQTRQVRKHPQGLRGEKVTRLLRKKTAFVGSCNHSQVN